MTQRRHNFDENDFQVHSPLDERNQIEQVRRQFPEYAPFIDNGGPHNFDLPGVYRDIHPIPDEQYYGDE